MTSPPPPADQQPTGQGAATTTTATGSTTTDTALLYIIAIFLPPLAVFSYFDYKCRAAVWINIALWILGWFPGVIHAFYIISKK
ncbi:hypothetical protein EDB84DRAFT_129191 [Lactarius hengduanensis]|nr:hypothetical protein EDB84DRAFT_129191 [Lactarius hengduanensis]